MDVAVVRDRLSAYHGTRIPVSFARLVAWLAADPAHVEEFERSTYLLPEHDLAVADSAVAIPPRPRTRYSGEPPEFVALARTGTDGEQIGVLELAPELERDVLPFVTFFPMDFTLEVCDLGDDLAGALAMYLAYPSEDGPRPLDVGSLPGATAPAAVWNGYLPHRERERPGYRFVLTADRAGVFAPADAFGPRETAIANSTDQREIEAALDESERALRAGHPASAIVIARNVRYAARGYGHDAVDRACAVWGDAALQLGRPWHAAMVAEVRAQNDADRGGSTVLSQSGIGSVIVFEDDAP